MTKKKVGEKVRPSQYESVVDATEGVIYQPVKAQENIDVYGGYDVKF